MKFSVGSTTANPSQDVARADRLAMQVIEAVRRGEPDAARPSATRLVQKFPKHAGAQQAMAEVYVAMGKFDEAIEHAGLSIKSAPNQAMPYVIMAMCLLKVHQDDKALKMLKSASKRARGDAEMTSIVASMYERMEDMDQALKLFKRAHEIEPDNSYHLERIGGVQRFKGKITEAEETYNRALEVNDEEWSVYGIRSSLRDQTPDDNHIDELKTVLQRGTAEPLGKAHVLFALAKEHEDIGDYTNSFRYLKQGCDSKRSTNDYLVDDDIRTMGEISRTFDATRLDEGASGCEVSDPIFILGMPRTGTTLVERILSSHSKVESLGEMGIFAEQMVRSVKENYGSQVIPVSERTRLTSSANFQTVGQGYIDGVRDKRGNTPYFIDKLPHNFLHIGPIHLALPKAKIIQLDRHPMDTCYSVYKQLFGDAYPFSYNLEELGRYFVAYHKLMEHWHSVLPGVICTIRYEKMIEDQERESRRLIEHCGLKWEDSVLAFHENKRASMTASASQVRSPIYQSSIEKWRQYESELSPLRNILEDNGICTD